MKNRINIKEEICEDDFIIRMSGDEFLIVFKGMDGYTSEKVWNGINNRYKLINHEVDRTYMISVSHGNFQSNNYERSKIEVLIKDADEKTYMEKKLIKRDLKVIK